MAEKFSKYWDVIHGVMRVAIALDPIFKMKLLDYFFHLIYGDDDEDQIMRIQEFCYDLLYINPSKKLVLLNPLLVHLLPSSMFVVIKGFLVGFDMLMKQE